jgi:tRNA(Glu) U13 pseudouridine synthase TruD
VMVEPAKRGVQLRFSLPKGAYATCVLREIMKSEA